MEIKNLTMQRKNLERGIKRLEKRKSVLSFLVSPVKVLSTYHRGTDSVPKMFLIGTAMSALLGLGALFLVNPQWWMLVLALMPLGASVASYNLLANLEEKTEGQINKLKEERMEIVKQLDCARLGEKYVAPVQETAQNKDFNEVLDSLSDMLKKEEEKRRQNLLEKARQRHIEVDKILKGREAFENKSEYDEAKKDFENFMEENDSRL